MNGSLRNASPEVHTVDELLWLSAIPENHSGTVPHLTHHRVIALFGFSRVMVVDGGGWWCTWLEVMGQGIAVDWPE